MPDSLSINTFRNYEDLENDPRFDRPPRSPRTVQSRNFSGPRMPAAFGLVTKMGPRLEPPLMVLKPTPLPTSIRPMHRHVSSRSCENIGIAFSSPTEAQQLQENNIELDDVLMLYQEHSGSDEDEGSIEATPRPSPERPTHHGRDRYGFRCSELETYKQWSSDYDQTLTRRKKKWDTLLQESGLTPADGPPMHFPPRSSKVQRYVRKGIPPEYRGQAWFFYSNGYRRLKEHPGVYAKLAKDASTLKDNNTDMIERDLHRTFPDNIYYRPDGYVKPNTGIDQTEPSIITSLRRVLQAFALYRPKVGYCQSLNFIAGLFLLFLNEEKSFWMLVLVTTEFLPNVHDANLEGANIDQAVLMLSIKENLPAIWSKMGSGHDIMSPGTDANNTNRINVNDMMSRLPPITLVTAAWFMSAFTGILPIETTLRVWDCFFYEGSKILFRIALTILKLGEPRILAVQEPMEIFQIVQNLPKSMLDPAELMEACFKRRNGFGHLSQKEIDTRRDKVGKIRAKAMTHRKSRDDSDMKGRTRSKFWA